MAGNADRHRGADPPKETHTLQSYYPLHALLVISLPLPLKARRAGDTAMSAG